VGPVVVVVVLPFLEFLVEQAGVVLNDAVEQSAEFFGVDAARTLHFSVDVAAVGVHVKRGASPGTPLKEDSKFSSDVQLATLWPSQMCGGYTSCSCRRAHACSSGAVFVTVTVRAARCRKPTSIAGNHGRSQRRCARTPTRAVLPAISPTPLRYRLPLWSPTTATAIVDRPARANSA